MEGCAVGQVHHGSATTTEAIRRAIQNSEESLRALSKRYSHTLLPLDDCLYALQPTIPHLTRSSLHRCLHRHGINRLPDLKGDKQPKKKFKAYPIGYFHIDIAEVQTAEGKLRLFMAIDRTSKFACAELCQEAGKTVAAKQLSALPSRLARRVAP